MNSVVSIDLTQLNPRLNPVRPGRFWIVSDTAGEDYAPRPRGFGGRQYRIENQGLEAPVTDRTVRMPWRNGTSGDALADVTHGYDRASRRLWRKDLTPASDAEFDRAYSYDALGQVKTADRGTLNANQTAIGGIPQEAEGWNYDEQGNWLTYDKAEAGTEVIDQSRRSNVSNQIIAIDGTNDGVAYDRNGNMTRIPTGDALTGAPRKLVWNAWDQLVEVRVESSGALLQTNAYDGLFRRTTRTLADSTVIHQYYNDQWKPIEERKDASTNPLNVYYWGARPGHRDDLTRRDRDTDDSGSLDETLWCLMDYFDPIAIINSSGTVQERYEYSAFGIQVILAPNYSTLTANSLAWDFLFHGQFTDVETGYQNYGYRFYGCELALFFSRDPLNSQTRIISYQNTENSLVNQVDLLGLRPSLPGENPALNPFVGKEFEAVCPAEYPCQCTENGEACGTAKGEGKATGVNEQAAIDAAKAKAADDAENNGCSDTGACECPENCQPGGGSGILTGPALECTTKEIPVRRIPPNFLPIPNPYDRNPFPIP